MKQEVNNINPTSFDISIEDFDALEGIHEFSKEYKKKKKDMLKEYRKNIPVSAKRKYIKTAVAVSLIIILIPIAVNAATNGEFFNRIWGRLSKENVASHDEILYNEQEFPYTYTFPEREYVDIDPEQAENLIGNHVSHEPIVKELGDTTLTILSSVHDGNAAIVEFTLERKGGVNAFHYSQLDNEFQGAQFSHDPTFWFCFPACSENIIVDLKRSTEDMLYCYDYMSMEPGAYNPETKGITLEVSEYPCTRGELFEADAETFDKYKADTKVSNILIPLRAPVKTTEYVNTDGGITSISPLAMKIDMDTGLGLSELNEELYDPDNIYYVSVNYKDKTRYIVQEHELQDIHTCDKKIDNTSGISCDTQGNCILIFNRLVDTDHIESITVNKTTYTLKP